MLSRTLRLVVVTLLMLVTLGPSAAEACGGSRAAICTWFFPGTGKTVTAELRGSALAEVFTASSTEKSANWISGQLYGNIPGLGASVVMRVASSRESFAEIRSLDTTGTAFFPAWAEQILYWQIDVLDKEGTVIQVLRNFQPVRLAGEVQSIPPYGSPFLILEDVDFFDVSKPDKPVIRLQGGQSFGVLENVGGVEIRQVAKNIDRKRGTFSATFDVVNTRRDQPIEVNWFASGIHGTELTGKVEDKGVAITSQKRISLSGSFDPANLDSGLVVHATSIPGAKVRAEGHTLIRFD